MNTKYGIVTIVSAVLVYLALQFVPDNLIPWRTDRDAQLRTQIETGILRDDTSGLFVFLKREFPAEYDAFLTDMAKSVRRSPERGDALQKIAFAAGRDFTVGLRRNNAHYLSTAPLDELRAYHLSYLALLESLRSDPGICARFAAYGGSDFSLAEASRLDLEQISKISLQTFQTIVAGRDRPEPHDPVRDADWAQVRSDWALRSNPTDAMKQALYSQEVTNPDYCEAIISFQRFMATDQSPSTVRALVAISVSVVAQ